MLRSFREHVAVRLWSEGDRGVPKVINNSRKASEIVIENDYIKNLVENSGLASLQYCSYATVDSGYVVHIYRAVAERDLQFPLAIQGYDNYAG